MSQPVTPFSLKDAPSLIEKLLPVQKLSVESFKEQEARQSKTLTALGSYWKGRKPLILNKACILGCLLPATENPKRDLEVFEKLMASHPAQSGRGGRPFSAVGNLAGVPAPESGSNVSRPLPPVRGRNTNPSARQFALGGTYYDEALSRG